MNQLDGIKKGPQYFGASYRVQLGRGDGEQRWVAPDLLQPLSPLDRFKMKTRFKTLLMQAVLD